MSTKAIPKKRRKLEHPLAITGEHEGPWYEFLASDEGKCAVQPNICLAASGPYLENRLWRAFVAGMKAGFEQRSSVRTVYGTAAFDNQPRS